MPYFFKVQCKPSSPPQTIEEARVFAAKLHAQYKGKAKVLILKSVEVVEPDKQSGDDK